MSDPLRSAVSQEREFKERSIQLLRSTVSTLCHFIWHKELRPGEHLWSIPVDKERDFDCILSDAITELERLRALASASASHQAKGEGWQPKVGDRVDYILEASPRNGRPNEVREPGTVTRVNGVHITVKVDRWPRKRTTSPRYLSARPASLEEPQQP